MRFLQLYHTNVSADSIADIYIIIRGHRSLESLCTICVNPDSKFNAVKY
jgi:hypothetical protein